MKLDVGMLTHDLKTLPDYARKVEAMGYDCLWSSETQHDPYLPLGVAATVTSRIKLGTNIATVFSRSPMITAHIAWDLQKASGGRFTLGLGTQVKAHNERRFSVKFESPGPKMAEAIRAIRAIWDYWQNGTQLDFKGRFYTFDVMTPFFNPGPIEHPRIPIFIAAREPVHVRRGGRAVRRPARASVQQPEVPARGRPPRRRGRAPEVRAHPEGLHLRHVLASWSWATRRRSGPSRRAWSSSRSPSTPRRAPTSPCSRPTAGRTSRRSSTRSPSRATGPGMADLITDEMLDTYAVTATYDKLRDELVERYDGLLDRTALYQPYQPSLDDPRLPAVIRAFNG